MSEILRRRLAALLLIAVIAVVALAIADVGPFEDPITEEERVEAAVEGFFAAAAAGDEKGFCDGLTPEARKSLAVNTAQQLQTDSPLECKDVLAVLQPVLFQDSTFEARAVSISGIRARVEARLKTKGSTPQPRTILMTRDGDTWLVSDLGD